MKKDRKKSVLQKSRALEFVTIGMILAGVCWALGIVLIIMGFRIVGLIGTSVSIMAWLYFYLGWRKLKGLSPI